MKQNVRPSGVYDDCYVFDIANFCGLVACREAHKKRDMGESLYEVMSADGVAEMLDYVKCYTEIPLLVKTAYGPALVIPSLVPSCSLVVMSYISVGGENLYRFCKGQELEVAYSHEVEAMNIDASASMGRAQSQYCRLFWDRLLEVFVGTAKNQMLKGDVTLLLEERIYALSRYVGCPVAVICSESVVAYGELDFSLFVGFVLVTMILSRYCSRRGEIAVSLENKSFGVAVMLSMAVKGREVCDTREIRMFNSLSDRKRVFFEYMCDGAVAHIRFSPVLKDWSYLEIKSQSAEECDCGKDKTIVP